MIEDRYYKYFKHDIENVVFLLNNLPTKSSESLEDDLKAFMSLNQVEIHAIIQNCEKELSDTKFKIFLNVLLAELSASTDFYKTLIQSNESEYLPYIHILNNFNLKIYSFITTSYQKIFPDLFYTNSAIEDIVNRFHIDERIEKANKFKLAHLIANGSLTFDSNHLNYLGEVIYAANRLSIETTIPRNYIRDTQMNSNTNRNIFTVQSRHILNYVIEKFAAEDKDLSPFFLQKYEAI